MRLHRWLLCLPALFAASVQGAEVAPEPAVPAYRAPGSQPAPESVKDWADRCTDFTINGWGFKDPNNALKMIGMFSDPAIYLEFAQRSLDPASYARIANTMLDPATAKNYLEWSDPAIYGKWAAAMMDPNFYAKAMQPMLDPATYMRWMTAPMDPRWWSVAMQGMNPGVWAKWMAAPLDPKVMAPLAKAADPNTSLRWMQAMADPASYRFWNTLTVPANGQGAAPPFPWSVPNGLPPTGAGSQAGPAPNSP